MCVRGRVLGRISLELLLEYNILPTAHQGSTWTLGVQAHTRLRDLREYFELWMHFQRLRLRRCFLSGKHEPKRILQLTEACHPETDSSSLVLGLGIPTQHF